MTVPTLKMNFGFSRQDILHCCQISGPRISSKQRSILVCMVYVIDVDVKLVVYQIYDRSPYCCCMLVGLSEVPLD